MQRGGAHPKVEKSLSMIVRKLLDLLSRKDRRRLLALLLMLTGLAMLEMIGVASIMPFMAMVANPATIHSNRWLRSLFEALGFSSNDKFLLFFGTVVLGVLILNNL